MNDFATPFWVMATYFPAKLSSTNHINDPNYAESYIIDYIFNPYSDTLGSV